MAKKKKLLILGVTAVVLLVVGSIVATISMTINYNKTHTAATIRICEEYNGETSDVYVQDVEFLEGDTYNLLSTQFTIESVDYDGTTKISFKPEVTDKTDKTVVDSVTLKLNESFSCLESSTDGESVSAQLTVVSHRYQ